MVETTSANPELFQEQVASLLVQPLEAQSVVLSSGPRIFDTASPLRIPKLTSGASVGFVGESEQIPEGDVDFDEVKLMPSDRKSLKVLIRFSNELLDAMAVAHANEVEPSRWFISGSDFFALRKLKATGTGEYLIQPDVTQATRYSLHGIPVTVTNKLSEGTAILANMQEVAVARDIDPSVTLLSERYAEYDEQAIRVVTRYDLGMLHPEGVVVLTADDGEG